MTPQRAAYVSITNYGATITVRCDDCGIEETHEKHRDAIEAAHAHTRDIHPRDDQ